MSLSSAQIRSALFAAAACGFIALLVFQITMSMMAPWWGILIGCAVGALVGLIATDLKRTREGLRKAMVEMREIFGKLGTVWWYVKEIVRLTFGGLRPLMLPATVFFVASCYGFWYGIQFAARDGMLAIFIFGVLGVFICLFVPPLLWLAFIGITIKLDFMGDLVKDCAKVLEIKREDAPEDVLKGKDPLSFHSWMTIEVLSYIVIGSFTIPFRKSMQVIKLMTLVYLRILAVAVAFCVLAVLALIAFCVALTVWVVSLPVTAPTTILFVTGLFAWKFFYYTHTKLVRIVVVDGLAGALLVHAAMSLLFGPLYAEFGPLARLGVCTLGAALCPALVYLNIQLVARRILKREPVL